MRILLDKEQLMMHQFSKDYMVSENDELGKEYKKKDETLNFDEIKIPIVRKVSNIFLMN